MGWTITEPDSGLSVALVPSAGDIQITDGYDTAVLYARRGASPWVTDTPRRAATVTVPDVVFTSAAAFEQLRTIRGLSRRCILTDDLGRQWPVKFVGDFTHRVIDTPGRTASQALIYVKLSVVGVA